MSIKLEIRPYTDKKGYVNPYIVPPNSGRSCDNSTMFTSEYYILLERNKEDEPNDADEWQILIENCMNPPGLLRRYPDATDQDAPDNMIAVLSAAKILNKPEIAQSILDYGFKHLGSFNDENPDKWTLKSFLWRQIQLRFSALCASNNTSLFKFWQWPLALHSAITIAVSCIRTDVQDTDSRRLAWHLIQATRDDSILCRLASKLWYKRLYKDYSDGMKGVNTIYFQMGHPFSRYSWEK